MWRKPMIHSWEMLICKKCFHMTLFLRKLLSRWGKEILQQSNLLAVYCFLSEIVSFFLTIQNSQWFMKQVSKIYWSRRAQWFVPGKNSSRYHGGSSRNFCWSTVLCFYLQVPFSVHPSVSCLLALTKFILLYLRTRRVFFSLSPG